MKPNTQPCVALFDLDGTLSWRDTLLPFLVRYVLHHPWRLLGVWRLPGALLGYLVDRDRGLLKSRVIRLCMAGATRAEVRRAAVKYVADLRLNGRFRSEALAVLEQHRAAGDRLVLLSASPDCYVPLIGESLGFERTVCTELLWRAERLDGRLVTPNRRGPEKSVCLAWLRTQYPGLPFIAYGNSDSDLDHMRHAERALLVNADRAARRHAAALQIPTADWH